MLPAGAFVLGVWLRTLVRREAAASNSLRSPLLLFLFLTVVNAVLAAWRYTDFWPVANRPYRVQIVNAEGLLAPEAIERILWASSNICVGVLVLFAVVHIATQSRLAAGAQWDVRRWLLQWLTLPLLVGVAAPVIVGLHQTENISFGANTVSTGPWLGRINATMSDANALCSFIVLLVPWCLGFIGLLRSDKRWVRAACVLGLVAGVASWDVGRLLWTSSASLGGVRYRIAVELWIAVCACALTRHGVKSGLQVLTCMGIGFLLRACIVLAAHAGARLTSVGLLVMAVAVIIVAIFSAWTRWAQRITRRRLVSHAILLLLLACCTVIAWFFHAGAPYVRTFVVQHPQLQTYSVVKRMSRVSSGSLHTLYRSVFRDRGPHIHAALSMIRDVPLTGVGIGCFTTELPNWTRAHDAMGFANDTVCNTYVLLATEQGIPALLVLAAAFGLWWRHWWRVWQNGEARWFWSFIGAGMAGILALLLMDAPTRSHEIQCLFWLFAAQPLCVSVTMPTRPRQRLRYGWLLLMLICGLYLADATTHLSLKTLRTRGGWAEREGFYSSELWRDQDVVHRVRHTRARAQEMTSCNGIAARLTWACLHPDITSVPVYVTFSIADVATNIIATSTQWQTLVLPLPCNLYQQRVRFSVSADRTWSGAGCGINADKRDIGVTLRDVEWCGSIGMFAPEHWPDDGSAMAGRSFQWTTADARELMPVRRRFVELGLWAPHTDLAREPVITTISVNDRSLPPLMWRTNAWTSLWLLREQIAVSGQPPDMVCLHLTTSRGWALHNTSHIAVRDVGVAVSIMTEADDIGFYGKERWQEAFNYRWAGRQARWAQQADSNGVLRIEYLLAHPDLAHTPVRWTLQVDDATAADALVTNAAWRSVTVQTEPGAWHACLAEVDRVWVPRDYGRDDSRSLGFAVRWEMVKP